jgi:Concanavalin A-like lectin/glucanases superfamily/Divergent InlB B-repeat domain
VECLGWPSRYVLCASLLLALLTASHGVVFAGQLTLTWIDNSSDELGFSIERSSGTAGTYAVIAAAPAGATSYTDLTVAAGVTYCYRVRSFNAAGYSGYSNASCGAPGSTPSLAVIKAGAGDGTVTSAPSGINCGASCSASYPGGTAVTLTAQALSGSTFGGWSGGGCGAAATCTVTLTASTVVTATFNAGGSPPPPVSTISVSSTSVQPGQSITVSFSGKAGQPQDFIALYVPGTSTNNYLDWRYLNGLTSAPSVAPASGSFTFPMPSTAGTYELRWVKDGDPYAVLAISPVITVSVQAPPSSPASISVSSTSVQPGQSITVSFSGKAGQPQDFIGLYVPGASTNNYLDWRYLNGLTSAPSVAPASGSFTFPMPSTAGTYELRWVKDGSTYTVLATSPAITSSAQAPPPGPAPSGLVAAYAFREGSGSFTADSSGSGNAGTISSAAWTSQGKFGSALLFNGISSYVNVGNAPSLQITGSMTVSAWIKATSWQFSQTAIVSKRTTGGYGFQLDTSSDTGARTTSFKLTSPTGATVARYGATPLQLDQWYYVTAVYDAAARSLNIYLNGSLDNGFLVGPVTGSQSNSSTNVIIGQSAGASTLNFSGVIDEVRVYNSALSPAQIQTDMNSPL